MKLSIGEFSKVTSLTIKSLRLYHDKGILVPAQVDSDSGYRYYNESNWETANAIRVLKSFEFSLDEIKSILSETDCEAQLAPQLRGKLDAISRKVAQYQDVARSIEAVLQQERDIAMTDKSHFDVEEKELDTFLIAGHRMKGAYHEIGKGFGIVGKKVGRHINGKAMGLYYDGEYKENDADIEACFPVRKGKSDDSVSVRELKGGRAITLIHKGPYDTLHISYKRLFEYVNEKGYETLLPTREVYQKGPGIIFKGNPNNYLTEIQFLIK